MSIEVEAELARGSNVFLTGEEVCVQITLRNVHPDRQKALAWGCVQLFCEGSSASESDNKNRRTKATTAVPKAKNVIFSSKPNILFCDIFIEAGKNQKFNSTHKIPLFDKPPSFKGNFAKYFWYISIAAQQVDEPLRMVRMPIKVLNIGVDVENPVKELPDDDPDFPKPSLVELAINRIDEICSLRKRRLYEISNSGSVFAKITMQKNTFKLGDDVVGKLEFTQEDVHCLQVLVNAETVETNLSDEQKSENIFAHCKEHSITASVRQTFFKLTLPMTAVPAFTNEFVKLRWRLHFQFVITREKVLRPADASISLLADDLSVETVKWNLPINVFTCNPFNAALVCVGPDSTKFVI